MRKGCFFVVCTGGERRCRGTFGGAAVRFEDESCLSGEKKQILLTGGSASNGFVGQGKPDVALLPGACFGFIE